MLFNSLTFVVFFVVVVTLYWSIHSWQARKNLLVVASYIFYGAWNPPFAALLFGTTAMDFWLGRQMAKARDQHARRRWLVASVCMNLSMLGFFQIRKLSAPKFSVAARANRGSSINRRIWTFCFRSEFPFTLSIHFRTRSTFIGACCDQRNLCVISFSPSPFFRSWWPVQSCAPVTFSRSFSIRHV